MKVRLLFPPLWTTETPYLSLPLIKSVLAEQLPMIDIKVHDLNLEFWRPYFEPESIQDLWKRVRNTANQKSALDSEYHSGEISFDEFTRKVAAKGETRAFLQQLILRHMPPFSGSRLSRSITFHDPIFTSASASRLLNDMCAFSDFLEDRKANPFYDIGNRLLSAHSGILGSEIVGIGISGDSQVLPALTLVRLLRVHNSNMKIVLGGAWISLIKQAYPQHYGILEQFADATFHGSELRPFLGYLSSAVNSSNAAQVKNTTPVRCAVDAPPDFHDLDLASYDYQGMLPFQMSTGCAWGQCSFCSFPLLEKTYHPGDPKRIVDQLLRMQKQYPGLKEIAFTDSLLEPGLLGAVCELLDDSPRSFGWRGYARFMPRYTSDLLKRMRRNGCRLLMWGLESASPAILAKMKKGFSPQQASRNLKDSAAAGIHNHLFLIYGYPGETMDDTYATIHFIRQHKDYVHSVSSTPFTQISGTPLGPVPRLGEANGVESSITETLSLALEPDINYTSWEIHSGELFAQLAVEITRHHLDL